MNIQNDDDLIKEWLEAQNSDSTRLRYTYSIDSFKRWWGKPLTEFLALDFKDKRNTALKWQQDLKNQKTKRGATLSQNTIISHLTALGSFTTWNGQTLMLKGKRLRTQLDLSSHVFSNGDLVRMFDVAGVEQKALLATMASLGWEVSAVLALKREFIASNIKKASEDGKPFIFFQSQRAKTGEPRLGVLNPLAIEWLEKHLRDWKGQALWSYTTKEGVNSMLHHLARDAQITLTGRVHTHLIRKWVMSGLSRSRFNDFTIKYLMGKAIPPSDMTYLQTLQLEIEEQYPEAYASFLCIRPEKIKHVVDDAILRKTDTQEEKIKELQSQLGNAVVQISKLMETVGQLNAERGLKTQIPKDMKRVRIMRRGNGLYAEEFKKKKA